MQTLNNAENQKLSKKLPACKLSGTEEDKAKTRKTWLPEREKMVKMLEMEERTVSHKTWEFENQL